jgi:hypothetical protein
VTAELFETLKLCDGTPYTELVAVKPVGTNEFDSFCA